MRKIELEMLGAIHTKKHWSGGNTVFRRTEGTDSGWELLLHGHKIATFDAGGKYYPIPTYVSLAGYPTKTTCSRLNALDGVSVRIKNGVPYLDGHEIESDGWWSPCNLNF